MTDEQAMVRSRRAFLAGAFGGLVAVAAQATRPLATSAGTDVPLLLDHTDNSSTSATGLTTTSDTGLRVTSTKAGGATGLIGEVDQGNGVVGIATGGESTAVLGNALSPTGEVYGFVGQVMSSDGIGVMSWHLGNGTAIAGRSSDTDTTVATRPHVGVLGIADADVGAARGVVGVTSKGQGVRGEATSVDGYGVFSHGRMSTDAHLELREVTAPSSPSTNRVVLFARDSGGKTQLCARFSNGKVRVLATM